MGKQVVWAVVAPRHGRPSPLFPDDARHVTHLVFPVAEEEGSGFFLGYSICHTYERPYDLVCQLGETSIVAPCGECLTGLLSGYHALREDD
jgi:hypothetical protein